MSANPYQPPVDISPQPKAARSNPFGRFHLTSFMLLWLFFGGLYAWIVSQALDPQPGKTYRVIMTPLVTLASPMVGAFSRGATQGCCFDTSVSVLMYAFPLPLLALLSQSLWRPVNLTPRILRGFLWLLFWFFWFACGILPLGHALS